MVRSQYPEELTIGKFAAAANVGVETVRFYQRRGLLTTPKRIDGIRRYNEADVSRLRFIRQAANDPDIHINKAVARSEAATGDRNYALAHFMRGFGKLKNTPERTLGTYFHQCAVEMSCVQLARSGLFLTAAPGLPRVIAPDRIRRICSIMMMCGHYDASGDFAFRVGLPGKSGVGGGILVIAPGRAAIAVWSPGLNAQGNSQLGTDAVELLARRTGWSVFSGRH